MSAGHARLSASSAHRWLHCAGSVASSGKDGSSVYAAAGTYAHHIAAVCLTEGRPPGLWLGNKTIVDGHTVECDQEMIDAIQVYLDAVADDRKPGDKWWVEMPLLESLKYIDLDMGGTADYVRYRPSTKHLKVMDFKFGSGTYVEADDNEQMKVYALGAMVESKEVIHEVEVVVVQPRHEGAAPVRPWSFKAVDILDFVADLQCAALATRNALPELNAGDWCKFCPHARTCPELEKKQHALVAQEFSVVSYDPDKLAAALQSIPLVKERIKAIEEFAYAEALKGSTIPGFKLVDKRATRKWKSEGDVIEWAQKNAIDPFEKPGVLSPAQLEKKIGGKKKETEALLAPFVEKVSSGTVLVPVSDERQPAKRITAEDFKCLPG
jgi:hypothetical protein